MKSHPTRRVLGTVIAAAVLTMTAVAGQASASAGGAPASASDAVVSQRTLFDYTAAQTASSYWEPRPAQPSNYVSPVNYAGGHFYLKLDVLSKPSSKTMIPQVCMWRHGARKFQYETCSSTRVTFSTEGTYWIDLGAPAGWWKKSGGYDWTKQASVMRIMLKDPATKKLFLSQKCGSACYRGGDLGEHIPVQMHGELIMVAKGATLAPPANWAGCPAGWSPQC